MKRRQILSALGGTGAALAASPLSAGINSAITTASVPTRWDAKVDLLIVGSGGAGTSAAIEARRLGLKVLVIESLLKRGGSSAMSGGVVYAGGGTALQKANGIEDSAEAMYNYIVEASGLYADREKAQVYCEESIAHFNWLVECGVQYSNGFTDEKGLPGGNHSLYYSGNELNRDLRAKAAAAPRGHVPGHLGWTGGKSLMQALHEKSDALKAKTVTQASAEQLILGDDNCVIGARVSINGQSQTIAARLGVVIAAGGFIHNRPMVEHYAPELADCTVAWGNAGDLGQGIALGVSAGGALKQMHHGFAIMPLYQPDHVLRGMVVNAQGQRFVAEDGYHAFMGHDIAYHQGGKAFLITDARSQYGYEDYRVVEIARANSITELEKQLQLPEQSLEISTLYYNTHAEHGRDPLFGKSKKYLSPLQDAPFIAYDLGTERGFFPTHTFGGLHTNSDAQVLNFAGEVIPGLYAAGRSSAGLPVAPYIASGISLGDATFFGRQAARHAAGRDSCAQ